MRLRLVSLLVVLTAAGCWVPAEADPPTLADEPLVEMYRIPSPVPAPGEGRRQWAFVDPESGVIAEGTGLAAVDFETGLVRWTRTLPGTYAASSANRPMVLEDHLVLPGRDGSVRVLSRWSGDLLWERKSPAGRVVVAGSGPEAAVVHNHCDARGCDLTALLLETGKPAGRIGLAARVGSGGGFLRPVAGAAPQLPRRHRVRRPRRQPLIYQVGDQVVGLGSTSRP
jgi:hypothetical protein